MRPLLAAADALLLLALVPVLLAPVAAAASEDTAWADGARQVTMTPTQDGFRFSSTRGSNLGADTLSGAFDASGRLDMQLAADAPEPVQTPLAATWRSLVEYRDADGDGRFGLSDPVVQTIEVASLQHDLVLAPLLDGGQSAVVTYALPGNASGPVPVVPPPHGAFRLTFRLVHSSTAVEGQTLHPADLGVAVQVKDFPFRSDASRLALVGDVSAPGGLLARPDGAAAEAGNFSLAVAWAPQATADGAAQPAPTATLARAAGLATVIQSWPRGDTMEQKGTVSAHHWQGVAAALSRLPPGDWRYYALGVAAVAVGLGIPSLRRLREA